VHLAHGEEKVLFAADVYHKLNRPEAPKKLAHDFLDEKERKMLMKLLGPTAFAFTPNNPSGHHTLDLSSVKEREVAVKLLDARNLQEEILKSLQLKFNKHKGGLRDFIEQSWLNASVNGVNFLYSRSMALPRSGVLDLDFVSLTKPQDLEKRGETIDIITDENWANFIKDILQEGVKLIEIVTEFRELSNIHIFKCSHVRQMLRLIDQLDFKYSEDAASEAAAYIPVRAPSGSCATRSTGGEGDTPISWNGPIERGSTPGIPPRTRSTPEGIKVDLENLTFMKEEEIPCVNGFYRPSRIRMMSLETSKLRVEICVTAYARTLDYLGFYGIHGLFKSCLSRPEREMLKERIGILNMFHPDMVVDYYELDLKDRADRWIMQEVVHLAIVEPGENCVNSTFNDMDMPIPASWQSDVPRKDVFTCFYCREQGTTNNVCANANKNHPGAVSTDVIVPAKTSWTQGAKCWQIKQKMAEKYAAARDCFKAIDTDGGGSIERTELARGLFSLGIWLRPFELKTLFECVDKDNGGEVDLSEFEDFWNMW